MSNKSGRVIVLVWNCMRLLVDKTTLGQANILMHRLMAVVGRNPISKLGGVKYFGVFSFW